MTTDDRQSDDLSFGLLEDALGFLLLAGWRHAYREFTKNFKDVDITPAAHGVLVLIAENPNCAIGDIGRAMGITPNNIARLVDRLAERKLISKSQGRKDGRVRALNLTPEGHDFVAMLALRHAAMEVDLNRKLGKDRVEALCALLRPLIAPADVDDPLSGC